MHPPPPPPPLLGEDGDGLYPPGGFGGADGAEPPVFPLLLDPDPPDGPEDPPIGAGGVLPPEPDTASNVRTSSS